MDLVVSKPQFCPKLQVFLEFTSYHLSFLDYIVQPRDEIAYIKNTKSLNPNIFIHTESQTCNH